MKMYLLLPLFFCFFVLELPIPFFIYNLQDWALGVLHAKIIAAITLMGPQWWLKTVIEQVCSKCHSVFVFWEYRCVFYMNIIC